MNISSVNSRLRIFSCIIISLPQEISGGKQDCFLSICYLVWKHRLCLADGWQMLVCLFHPETDHGFKLVIKFYYNN